MKHYLMFIYVNLAFLVLAGGLVYLQSAEEVRANWPQYRCNPAYWVFSSNPSRDFTQCVQTSQLNMMGYILQPMNYMVSGLTSMGGELAKSVNGVRGMIGGVRGFLGVIIENIFGVFLNLIVEMQKMIISIKDMVGKMVGIVVTIMYMLDGSVKTMQSAWAGPPGKMVKSIGSCFHESTLVRLADDRIVPMSKIPVGAELYGGGKVQAVMRLANLDKSPFYAIPGGVAGSSVFVTGDHFVYCDRRQRWVRVRDAYTAGKCDYIEDQLACLITTDRRIRLGSLCFWDWEDDELAEKDRA